MPPSGPALDQQGQRSKTCGALKQQMISVRANCNRGSRPPIERGAKRRRTASYEEVVLYEVQSSLIRYDVKYAMLLCGNAAYSLATEEVFHQLAFVWDGKRTPAHAGGELGTAIVGRQRYLCSRGCWKHVRRRLRRAQNKAPTCVPEARTMVCIRESSASSLILNSSFCWTRHLGSHTVVAPSLPSRKKHALPFGCV